MSRISLIPSGRYVPPRAEPKKKPVPRDDIIVQIPGTSVPLAIGTFIFRLPDLLEPDYNGHIWSIENRVLLLKWIPSEDDENTFLCTNRYSSWNLDRTDLYYPVDWDHKMTKSVKDTGIVYLLKLPRKEELKALASSAVI